MILRIAVLFPLLPALVGAAAGDFNYDDNDADKGPAAWANLPLDDNQCGGDSNSPIALESRACDIFEEYVFTVSARVPWTMWCFVSCARSSHMA